MATNPDVLARRQLLWGDKQPTTTGAAAATVAALTEQLAALIAENDTLRAESSALKGGLLGELRTAINAVPRPSAQVVPLNQGSAPAAPGPASGQPTAWILETSDSMGNPRRVRVTPEFKR